jgi:hypothetical protein
MTLVLGEDLSLVMLGNTLREWVIPATAGLSHPNGKPV